MAHPAAPREPDSHCLNPDPGAEAPHTPTPWRVVPYSGDDRTCQIDGSPGSTGVGHFVATVGHSRDDLAQANAELIVSAVNSRKSMQYALGYLIDFLDALTPVKGCGHTHQTIDAARMKARAALALAEGR